MDEILNSIPEHRDKTRMQIFQDHCFSFHNCHILFEYNEVEKTLVIISGKDKRTGKILKWGNLLTLGELLVLPVVPGDFTVENLDPAANFVLRVV